MKTLIVSFFVWTAFLLFVSYFSIRLLPLQSTFLGGGIEQYSNNPLLFGRSNFDGEHYIGIAQFGYRPLEYFFFPLYPSIITLVNSAFASYIWSGVVISMLSSILGLFAFYYLLKKDYSDHTVRLIIFSLLVFPTSFFLQTVYTESLFSFLAVTAFLCARSNKWLLAGIFAALASSTRLVGLALFPALILEYGVSSKWNLKDMLSTKSISLFVAPIGFLLYVLYLWQTVGDPLAFYHNVQIFGAQRADHIVLFPQVFYRYIFKIIPNSFSYWPTLTITLLEFVLGLTSLILAIYSFFKLRASYSFFLIASFLLPTFSGSFSSFPRYMLTIFPAFILIGTFLNKQPKYIQIIYFVGSLLLLSLCTMLFMRGYWVS